MNNPYQILGVNNQANEEEINKAYRKLARQYHPDRNPGDKEAEQKFKEIQAAYDEVTKPTESQPEDIFNDIFSQIFNFGHPGPQQNQMQLDVHIEVALDFWESVDGASKTLTVPKLSQCRECHGSGSAEMAPCLECAGEGTKTRRSGHITMSSTCPRCYGSGKRSLKDCSSCKKGFVRTNQEVKVDFPVGTQDNMFLKVKGFGNEVENRVGNLIVHVRVNPHNKFNRRGDDLYLRFPVPYSILVRGGKVVVPGLNEGIEMTVNPLTVSGSIIRISKEGFFDPQARRKGDMLVEVYADTVDPEEVEFEYRTLMDNLYNWEKENVTPNMKAFAEECKRS